MAEDADDTSMLLDGSVLDDGKLKCDGTSVEKIYLLQNSDGSPPVIAIHGVDELDYHEALRKRAIHHEDSDFEEPCAKRGRFEKNEIDQCKTMLIEMNATIMERLGTIQTRITQINTRCQNIEDKIEILSSHISDDLSQRITTKTSSAAKLSEGLDDSPSPQHALPQIGPNVTLITLNSEEDYPDGSWLGDETDPEHRVRCYITPTELGNINRTCHTPEKMALTLLDYLFDRETQACSNISGMGKHGKKQLDPLLIYGIRCHLVFKFNIADSDWHRIKQNLDSKCRTAFRRKQKGMPLTVKAFRDKWVPQDPNIRLPTTTTAYIQMVTSPLQNGLASTDLTDSELTTEGLELASPSTISIPIQMSSHQPVSVMMEDGKQQIIRMTQGDIQLVAATPEQIAQYEQSGSIQVLTGNVIEAAECLPSKESP